MKLSGKYFANRERRQHKSSRKNQFASSAETLPHARQIYGNKEEHKNSKNLRTSGGRSHGSD